MSIICRYLYVDNLYDMILLYSGLRKKGPQYKNNSYNKAINNMKYKVF